MTNFCWAAFPLQFGNLDSLPQAIFKIRQDLIDALHCRSCFGAQVLLKNFCLFVMFASQFLPSQIGQSCHSYFMLYCIEMASVIFASYAEQVNLKE